MEAKPEIIFKFDMNSSIEEEISRKGWCNAFIVVLPDKSEYELIFYDPVRLMQDIKATMERTNLFAEPGLIVIEDVTKKNMEDAVFKIWKAGYFDSLKPINSGL